MPDRNPKKIVKNIHCPHYTECLDEAAAADWPGWACDDCPYRNAKKERRSRHHKQGTDQLQIYLEGAVDPLPELSPGEVVVSVEKRDHPPVKISFCNQYNQKDLQRLVPSDDGQDNDK